MSAPGLRARVGVNIRRLRHARKLSQEALAADASLDQGYMSRIEAGSINFRIEALARLAAALGVTPGRLLRDGDG